MSNANTYPVWEATYRPFGELTSTQPPAPNTYFFTGLERDAESALDHTWFRKYSPSQGRWCSADPLGGSIGNPQSLNRYVYVGNNPINKVDPFGLEACNLNIGLEFSVDVSAADRQAIQKRIGAVFGQRTDALGNSVTVSFNPGGQIDASVRFTNTSWLDPWSWGRMGSTSFFYYHTPSEVYVDNHRGYYNATHVANKLGESASHEIIHRLGVQIFHSSDPNNLMALKSTSSSSSGWQLTEQQISDLFKRCKELNPQRGNHIQNISGSNPGSDSMLFSFVAWVRHGGSGRESSGHHSHPYLLPFFFPPGSALLP